MTTGIATLPAIDLDWITRALRSARYESFTIEGVWVRLTTEVGRASICVSHRNGLLRFVGTIGDGSQLHPTSVEERYATLRRLQDELEIARLAWYHEDDRRFIRAEYDLPLVAGLAQGQFLAVLRTFLSDLAVARRNERTDA